MSANNLQAVTNDLIESYGKTAKNVIHAYRVGNERAAGFVTQRWESAVEKSAKRLTADVRNNALSAQKKLSGYYIKGITLTSDGAEVAVTKAVELASKGVAQAAVNAALFEKTTGMTALQKLAVAAVPAAESLSKVASRIEQQSGKLVNTVSGKKSEAGKRVSAFKKARAAKTA